MPGIFAYVPTVPGAVVSVVSSIPSPLPTGQTSDEYHSCGSMVVAGWNFDGNAFTPPPPVIPAPPAPTPAQVAQAAAQAVLNNGIVITSTSTPAVNGTYSLSQETQDLVVAVATEINTSGGSFPGGVSSVPWADASGTEHVFPNVTVFKEFALAIAAYVGAVDVYVASNGALGSLPTSNAVTIA